MPDYTPMTMEEVESLLSLCGEPEDAGMSRWLQQLRDTMKELALAKDVVDEARIVLPQECGHYDLEDAIAAYDARNTDA